jgi:hypothetical protein
VAFQFDRASARTGNSEVLSALRAELGENLRGDGIVRYGVAFAATAEAALHARNAAIVSERFQNGILQHVGVPLASPRQIDDPLGDKHDGGIASIVNAQGSQMCRQRPQ